MITMMKDFKKIIIAMIVACVIAASILVGGSSVDAATIKVKSGADVTEVEDSGKKIAYNLWAYSKRLNVQNIRRYFRCIFGGSDTG